MKVKVLKSSIGVMEVSQYVNLCVTGAGDSVIYPREPGEERSADQGHGAEHTHTVSYCHFIFY